MLDFDMWEDEASGVTMRLSVVHCIFKLRCDSMQDRLIPCDRLEISFQVSMLAFHTEVIGFPNDEGYYIGHEKPAVFRVISFVSEPNQIGPVSNRYRSVVAFFRHSVVAGQRAAYAINVINHASAHRKPHS